MHHQGIIHRDLKPSNLLWGHVYDEDGDVVGGITKISDFGASFSHASLRGTGDISVEDVPLADLERTAGSFAFFAPEQCIISSQSKASAL